MTMKVKAKDKEIIYNHVTDWTLCKVCGWYYSEKEVEDRVCQYCTATEVINKREELSR